jgi:hypothetical protein
MLSPYTDEIIGDHQCGFDVTTDQISCIRQMLEKKWEYGETVHQLFVDFKKAYDSGVPMKLVRLIKMCLNEMYSE